ncbi:MAG: hypothetical protein A2X94_08125 [Bdellovibrionales bacterium GWB1_55_8]|nr:MAG: hypothetical protein A2X94_08125 [Bdellovibrionales bacterium GWB1_55_8]
MNDQTHSIAHTIQTLLEPSLKRENLDVLDIVPIPKQGDRMVRLRTLEEALDDFDRSDDAGEVMGYLVQLKRAAPGKPEKAQSPAPAPYAITNGEAPEPSAQKSGIDSIYLPDGKLNVPFLKQNADLLFEAGEYTLARNVYKAIVQSGEKTAAALFGLARCYDIEGRIAEAQAHYEESIAYHPQVEAYQNLARLLIRQQKDQEAAEMIARALLLKELDEKQRFELHKACGNCWTRVNHVVNAEKHFQKALELETAADEVRANLGALYLQNNRHVDAKRQFQDAVASNPRNTKALHGLASCHLATGDKRQAHDFFAKSLDIELNNPAAVFNLVKCAFEIKSYATAARILEEYVETAPISASLLYSLAGLQFHLGRYQDARATTGRILEIAPQHTATIELQAMIDQVR